MAPVVPFIPAILSAVGVGVSAYSAHQAAQARNDAADYESDIAKYNAKRAEQARVDALARGEADVENFRRRARVKRGREVANQGASNLLAESGSFHDYLSDLYAESEVDAMVIINNSEREAAGLESERDLLLTGADFARSTKTSPLLAGATSLLSNAGALSNSFTNVKAAIPKKKITPPSTGSQNFAFFSAGR